MKKKIVVLIAVLLCGVMLLCSCSDSLKFNKMIDKKATYVDRTPAYNSATALELKGDLEGDAGDLVLFEDEDADDNAVYTVYNIATGATVLTLTDSETSHFRLLMKEVWNTTLILKAEMVIPAGYDERAIEMTANLSLLDKYGNAFWSKEGMKEEEFLVYEDLYEWFFADPYEDDIEKESFYQALDLFGFDYQMFRIADDGSVSKAFDYSPLARLPEVNQLMGEYYYAIDELSVTAYDANLQPLWTERAPSYALSPLNMRMPMAAIEPVIQNAASFFILNDGSVLMQYAYALAEDAEEYTYMDEEGYKYNLVTKLFKAKNGKEKELKKCEYAFMYIMGRDAKVDMDGRYVGDEEGFTSIGFKKKIENLAMGIKIENQRLALGEVLSNKGKVEGAMDGIIPNQLPMEFYMVAPGRWAVADMSFRSFLINEKGDVLGEISNADMYDKYLFADNEMYNYDLAKVADLDELKCEEILEMTDEGIVFVNEDGATMMVLADGSTKTLIEKDDETKEFEELYWNGALFIITDYTDPLNIKASIYNAAGNVIYTAERYAEVDYIEAESNNNLLLEVYTYDADGDWQTTYVLVKP